jgi:NADH:ubiquinone oxidoreductase subunit 6 (subunit J)
MISISFLIVVILINLTLIYNKTVNNLLSIVLLMFASCIFFFIHLRSEFLMFAYLIVYTGAIMVMCLFVVMTIDVKSENMKTTFSSDLGLSFVLTNVLTSILYYSFLYGGGTILSNLQDQEKDLRILKGKLEGTNSEKAFSNVFSDFTSKEM